MTGVRAEVTIDVYAVGLFWDLRTARGRWSHAGPRLGAHRDAVRFLWRSFWRKRSTWRDRKNYFNGYLAEMTPWPEGVARCGSGWTRRRALASLQRQIDRAREAS